MSNTIQLRDADTQAAVYPTTDVSVVLGLKEYCKIPVASSMPAGGFLPNVFYNVGVLAGDTTFLFDTSNLDSSILNVWHFVFTTPASAPTITWPVGIIEWVGGSEPIIAAGTRYEVNVLDGVAIYTEV